MLPFTCCRSALTDSCGRCEAAMCALVSRWRAFHLLIEPGTLSTCVPGRKNAPVEGPAMSLCVQWL